MSARDFAFRTRRHVHRKGPAFSETMRLT
jgi:hypothetical protein